MPMSTLPEITDCSVSALPWVYRMSSVRFCVLKKPAFCPSSETHCSQPPRCPTATLSASWAAAALTAASRITAAVPVLSIPMLRTPFGYPFTIARPGRRSMRSIHPGAARRRRARRRGVPQCLDAAAKRLRPFGEQARRQALCDRHVGVLALLDRRREPAAPGRQGMVWCRRPPEQREIPMRPEALAQALSLGHPQLAQPRPQRLGQLHLIAMLDYALAQLMQRVVLHVRPVRRYGAPRPAIVAGELPGDVGKGQGGQPPMFDRSRGACERCVQLVA